MKSRRKIFVQVLIHAHHVLLSLDVVGAHLVVPVWRATLLELLGIVLMVGVTTELVDALIRADTLLLVQTVIMVVVVVGALLPRHVCQELHLVLLLAHVLRAIGIMERAVQVFVALITHVNHVPYCYHAIGAVPLVNASRVPTRTIVRMLDIHIPVALNPTLHWLLPSSFLS